MQAQHSINFNGESVCVCVSAPFLCTHREFGDVRLKLRKFDTNPYETHTI